MFKKIIINEFNRKYAGKKLLFCNKIFEDIDFLPSMIAKCCHCTRMPYSPPVLYDNIINKFSFYDYVKKLDYIMHFNQTQRAVCKGCKFLKEQTVPYLTSQNIFKFITINHFTKCNSNCVYCAVGNKTEDIKYNLLPVLKDMHKQKLIASDCLFNWGGGEPTLCSEFEKIAEFLSENKYRQAVNSSGIIFSQTILNGLKDGSMSVQISPDSGTEETYAKIKRQNNFDKVWENIKRYSQYPDMLFVKYIFFSMNSNENDVRAFINKCSETGVKNIVIDCESNSVNNNNSPFGYITDEIVNLATLMKKLAVENNIKYDVSYQWAEKHRQYILN